MRSVPITCLAAAAGVALSAGWARAQSAVWLRQFGTSGEDDAWDLAPDGQGGVVVSGSTYGSLGGPNAGGRDAFVARYDGSGTQLWARQLGSSPFEDGYGVASDGTGGAFVGGWTYGSLVGPTAGGRDLWLARYDAAGTYLWGRQFGSNVDEDGADLAPDGAGGAYVAGGTVGGVGAPPAGQFDVLVARYNAAGTQVWVRQFGTAGNDFALCVAQDGSAGEGGLFVGGQTSGAFVGANAGAGDAWLARYDAAGARLWIRQFGGTGNERSDAVTIDGAGGVFIAGSTLGSLAGANAGGWDNWVARYDGAGTQLWIRQFGTAGHEVALGLAEDGAGGAYVCGQSGGGLPIGQDAWLARYDGAGARTWFQQFSAGGATESARALAPIDGAGGGFFAAGASNGNLGPTPVGGIDAWVARFDTPCYPDCTGDGVLTVADFGCFQTRFVVADFYADCTADNAWTVADFGCFQTKFVVGCP